jgi:hypothetical protein
MLLALFALAMIAGGYAGVRRLFRGSQRLEGWEHAGAVAVATFVCAMIVDWSLALARALTPAGLTTSSLVVLALSARDLVLGAGAMRRDVTVSRGRGAFLALALAPLLVWIGYVLFRGSVLFAADHDGLAYHLTKAVELYQAHGFRSVDGHTARITTFPDDYELLLADVMTLTGNDHVTEWVSTATYVALGLVAGAMSRRWWGNGTHPLLVVLVTLGTPVALLHAGTHKNDLMFATWVVSTATFGARWAIGGQMGPFAVMALSLALAAGTKINAVLLVPAIAPLVVVRAIAWSRSGRPRPTTGAVLGATGVLALALLVGGVTYVTNLVTIHSFVSTPEATGYGAWGHLWMFPVLAFLRPFTGSGVWVPWRGERWFWPSYDLYFSHFGLVLSLLVVALPFGIARYARSGPSRPSERALGSVVLGASFFAVLPLRQDLPIGYFEGYVRYVLFVPALVALWTVAPLARELEAGGKRGEAISCALTLAAAAALGLVAVPCAIEDRYTPASFLAQVVRNPELERYVPDGFHAANWADSRAGQQDVIAFDGSRIDAWPYPLYGATLARHVIYLHPERGDVVIPDEVKWVVIDRAWNRIFGNPEFRDFGQWDRYLYTGELTELDQRLFRRMLKDARYKLVYHDPRLNQSVFARADLVTDGR